MPSQSSPWAIYREEPGHIYSYERVRPGDVGYLREGAFHLLFSAGIPLGSRTLGADVPLTFEPLDVGPIIQRARPPGYLRTNTVRQIKPDVGDSLAVACTVDPGAKISFELAHKQGAALITNHPTHREDIERKLTFKTYVKRHYDSWVDFARELGHGDDIRPVLVTGVDLTREFATIAYSDNQTRMECEFSAAVPGSASTSVSVWGSWRTRGLVHTNCGPYPTQRTRSSGESSTPESEAREEYNQCVFIRYFTIRKRLFIPTVIEANAGPHQLPKGNHGDGTSCEEAFQVSSVVDSMDIDLPETGSPTGVFDDVIHNVPTVGLEHHSCLPLLTKWTKDDRDAFDVVAEFIFQRSGAKSVLLHHHDIQDFLQGDEEDLPRLLAESGAAERVEIDENGIGQLLNPIATALSELTLSDSDIGDGTHGQILPAQTSAVTARTQQPEGQGATLHSLNEVLADAVYQRLLENIVRYGSNPRVKLPSGTCIPQRPYCPRTPIKGGMTGQVIMFATADGACFPAVSALAGQYNRLVDGGSIVFTGVNHTINLRIEWPGYDGWGAQIRTVDYREEPTGITRAKLVKEIAKQLEKFIEKMGATSIDSAYGDYKVGPGGIELDHIQIASLEQVSRGSWQPRLIYISP